MTRLHGTVFTVLLCCGCVAVPYSVPPTVEHIDSVELAEDGLVSIGPRRFLEKLAQNIASKEPRIEFIDGLAFRDAAFPQGGWRQTDLLESSIMAHVARKLDVRLLVLVGPEDMTVVSDEKDRLVPMLGGTYTGREHSELDATVIDVQTAKIVKRMRVSASGRGGLVMYFIVGAAVIPRTQAAVIEGISSSIADTIREHVSEGTIRIALLAVESSEAAVHETRMRRMDEAGTNR